MGRWGRGEVGRWITGTSTRTVEQLARRLQVPHDGTGSPNARLRVCGTQCRTTRSHLALCLAPAQHVSAKPTGDNRPARTRTVDPVHGTVLQLVQTAMRHQAVHSHTRLGNTQHEQACTALQITAATRNKTWAPQPSPTPTQHPPHHLPVQHTLGVIRKTVNHPNCFPVFRALVTWRPTWEALAHHVQQDTHVPPSTLQ